MLRGIQQSVVIAKIYRDGIIDDRTYIKQNKKLRAYRPWDNLVLVTKEDYKELHQPEIDLEAWHSMHGRQEFPTGESKLALAIIEMALKDASGIGMTRAGNSRQDSKKLQMEAIAWMMGDIEGRTKFEDLCDLANLNTKLLMQALKRILSKSPLKHLLTANGRRRGFSSRKSFV